MGSLLLCYSRIKSILDPKPILLKRHPKVIHILLHHTNKIPSLRGIPTGIKNQAVDSMDLSLSTDSLIGPPSHIIHFAGCLAKIFSSPFH